MCIYNLSLKLEISKAIQGSFFKSIPLKSHLLQDVSQNFMKAKAIYPGTFDPITNGHIDIICRASMLFSELVVGVASNQKKSPYFSLARRIELIQSSIGDLANVKVLGFNDLLIDFARNQGASIILRGLRAVNDFEYELQLAGMNRKMASDIETLFLTPSEQVLFISSSLVREIAQLGGDVSQFVPECVAKAFQNQEL